MAAAAVPKKRRRSRSISLNIVASYRSISAERERKRLHAGIEKLDLEAAIRDRPRLADQVIQALLGHRALALLVDVAAVRASRRLAVDAHAEPHRRTFRRRSQDHMEIAGVKA